MVCECEEGSVSIKLKFDFCLHVTHVFNISARLVLYVLQAVLDLQMIIYSRPTLLEACNRETNGGSREYGLKGIWGGLVEGFCMLGDEFFGRINLPLKGLFCLIFLASLWNTIENPPIR